MLVRKHVEVLHVQRSPVVARVVVGHVSIVVEPRRSRRDCRTSYTHSVRRRWALGYGNARFSEAQDNLFVAPDDFDVGDLCGSGTEPFMPIGTDGFTVATLSARLAGDDQVVEFKVFIAVYRVCL